MGKMKNSQKKKKIHELREPVSRENYKKWPTASLVLTGLACGSIFFAASNPVEIHEAKNEHLALQIMFMVLGVITLLPSVFVTMVFGTFFILKMAGVKIPRWVLKRFPFLQPFYDEAKRGDDEDSFLKLENKRREIIGDTMLELDNSSSESTATSSSAGSDIWTTKNSIRLPGISGTSKRSTESDPESGHKMHAITNPPRIIIDSPSESKPYQERGIDVVSPERSIVHQPVTSHHATDGHHRSRTRRQLPAEPTGSGSHHHNQRHLPSTTYPIQPVAPVHSATTRSSYRRSRAAPYRTSQRTEAPNLTLAEQALLSSSHRSKERSRMQTDC